MEDHYGIFLVNKEIFLEVINGVKEFALSSSIDIKDNSLIFLEFLKEFYMNYPLRGQSYTVLGSTFDEAEFSNLQNSNIKKYHRSVNSMYARSSDIERSTAILEESDEELYKSLKDENPEVMKYLRPPSSEELKIRQKIEILSGTNITKLEEEEESKLWGSKSIHLAYEDNTIISIIGSSYLSSKIIIRDIAGKHGWLITEHRVLDYNCLNTIDYNDKAIIYRNVLEIKGDKKFKDITTAKKTVIGLVKEEEKELELKIKEALKSPNEEDLIKFNNTYNEQLKKLKDNDTLIKTLSLLHEHLPNVQNILRKDQVQEEVKMNNELKKRVEETDRAENALSNITEAERKLKLEEKFRIETAALNLPYQSEQTTLDHARVFLSHLGGLNTISGTKLALLDGNESEFRSLLKFLDSQCELRRSMKIGVIYVGEGQYEQRTIFLNTKGSRKYETLLTQLGQFLGKMILTPLKTHNQISYTLLQQPMKYYSM